jgi:hypothetical protein
MTLVKSQDLQNNDDDDDDANDIEDVITAQDVPLEMSVTKNHHAVAQLRK